MSQALPAVNSSLMKPVAFLARKDASKLFSQEITVESNENNISMESATVSYLKKKPRNKNYAIY